MEIVRLTVAKRPTYETGADKEPYSATVQLRDTGSNEYRPDITLHLTADLIEPILKVVLVAAADAFTDAAQQFQTNVLSTMKEPSGKEKGAEAPSQD